VLVFGLAASGSLGHALLGSMEREIKWIGHGGSAEIQPGERG
jgi:hypothetical protein